MIIGEIKMNKEKINMKKLKEKSKNLVKKYKDYNIDEVGFGLIDIDDVLEEKYS